MSNNGLEREAFVDTEFLSPPGYKRGDNAAHLHSRTAEFSSKGDSGSPKGEKLNDSLFLESRRSSLSGGVLENFRTRQDRFVNDPLHRLLEFSLYLVRIFSLDFFNAKPTMYTYS